MAKITDPDNLEVAVNTAATTEEVEIQTGAKTLKLTLVGGLNDTAPGKTSGVTAKAVYSFLKEEWLNGTDTATLRRFKFPLKMIFEGSFIWVNGWSPADAQTRDLFRDAGFQEGVSANENACMVSLGSVDAPGADLAYYTQASGFTEVPTNYDKTGELNENIDITGNTTYKKSFIREQGKLYAEYNLLFEQGLSAISFQAYSFPLSNGTDLKITASDVTIDGNAPYTGMEINFLKGTTFNTATATTYVAAEVLQDTAGRWFFVTTGGTVDAAGVADYTNNGGTAVLAAYFGEELIGSTYYAFNRYITCNGGTDVESYEYMMRSLRKTADINDDNVGITAGQGGFGIVNGNVGELLAVYVGDTLKPKGGVLLRGFDANSTNNIVHSPITVDGGGVDPITFVPVTTSEVQFPFVAAGNFNFSTNLDAQPDAQTFYTVYFDYITRTTGSYTLTLSAGDIGDLTWGGTDLDHIIVGDYINLTGFVTNAGNNGLYLVNTVAANTMNITHQAGTTLITETATVTVDEDPFESPGAIIVNDNAASPMSGQITGITIAWDFDYTNNVQGGRTGNTPAPIRVVAQALDGAEWIDATHTITAATGQNIAINANDERNYSNPV